jgi:hypothetical protein
MAKISTSFSRNPHLVVAVNNGATFLGSIEDLDKLMSPDAFNGDDEELMEHIYDWAYDLDLDVEIIGVFDLDFWEDVLPQVSLGQLQKFLDERRFNRIYQSVTYNKEIIKLVEAELKLREG